MQYKIYIEVEIKHSFLGSSFEPIKRIERFNCGGRDIPHAVRRAQKWCRDQSKTQVNNEYVLVDFKEVSVP